jgi:quercetin dioxygenase-like cupin family protein/DNA-binding XRE family transcriptional regulator
VIPVAQQTTQGPSFLRIEAAVSAAVPIDTASAPSAMHLLRMLATATVHGGIGEVVPGVLESVIAMRVREFRLTRSLSVGAFATQAHLSKAMVSKIENAQTSCSLSTLSRLAEALDVPVTALFRGVDAEREAVFTESGHGARIVRRGSCVGHQYHMLGALRREHKRLEPLLVTLTEASEVFPQFQHPGSEFLYMLSGTMVYSHGDARYEMKPGDSLIFDGEGPHGPIELRALPIQFLSITDLTHTD